MGVGAPGSAGSEPSTPPVDDVVARGPTSDVTGDAGTVSRLLPATRRWWVEQFGEYVPVNGGLLTPPQRGAIPHVLDGENALVCAPTGSGKTLASFTAVLDDLFRRAVAGDLENSVYCLYVSPLKSLANDIARNLEAPLDGITENLADRGHDVTVRQAIRHGDTPSAERQKMLETTPHVLNTTPETLAILLNSPKFREKLRTVEYVVVDEIHSLAANKRGSHLSVSLERLEDLCHGSPTRIGCSATVEPLTTMGEFLVGGEIVAADTDDDAGTGEDTDDDAGTDEDTDGDPGTSDETDDDAGTEEGPETDENQGGEVTPREFDVVDARFVRDADVRLESPTPDLVNARRDVIQGRFYDRLAELVDGHEQTLVFTNTRSGAERVLQRLREDHGFDEDAACHHGSLSKERRQRVEEGLKSGDLRVVTTSTSLELGVDMPHVDLVVQVGSPKSVASLLQRVGRAGHRLGQTVEGRVIALDRDELVECAVMLAQAESGFVDRAFVPELPLDVAAQHVYGMAINEVRREADVRETLRRAYPFRNLDDGDWERLLAYLTADYAGLEDRNVYAKVWRDANDPPDGEHHYPEFDVDEPLLGKRGRLARVIYMQNVGTIPDSFDVQVFVRGSDEWVGSLDEGYLDTLEPGEVFALGGGRYAYRYRRGSKVYVDPTSQTPTVPSWFSERLPLSYDLGREMTRFQGDLLARLASGGPAAVREWLRNFPLDENAVRAVARLFDQQVKYAGPDAVSTDARVAVEEVLDRTEYRRRYHVHSLYGRRFNDGLSRLLAHRVASETSTNVQIAVADNGFTITMPLNRKVDVAAVLRDLDPESIAEELRDALRGTDLLERYFRINATRSLMILKRYKGHEKSAARQQVDGEILLSAVEEYDEFAVLEETYRELLEDKLNLAGVREVVEAVQAGDVEVTTQTVDSPSPRAFGLATLAASDVVLAEDEGEVLREFHARVMEHIDDADAEELIVDGG